MRQLVYEHHQKYDGQLGTLSQYYGYSDEYDQQLVYIYVYAEKRTQLHGSSAYPALAKYLALFLDKLERIHRLIAIPNLKVQPVSL